MDSSTLVGLGKRLVAWLVAAGIVTVAVWLV